MNTVNINVELSNAIHDNGVLFNHWYHIGKPEAYDQLNNHNRKLIQAYANGKSNGFGININENVLRPLSDVRETEMTNFCFDYVLDGDMADVDLLVKLLNEWRNFGKVNTLERIYAILDEADAVCLIWS